MSLVDPPFLPSFLRQSIGWKEQVIFNKTTGWLMANLLAGWETMLWKNLLKMQNPSDVLQDTRRLLFWRWKISWWMRITLLASAWLPGQSCSKFGARCALMTCKVWGHARFSFSGDGCRPSSGLQRLQGLVEEFKSCQFVSRNMRISWIIIGFSVAGNWWRIMRILKDYLFPRLNNSWTGFQRKEASYQDMMTYSACLFARLTRSMNGRVLIPRVLVSFWTEHSERATLPTGLAFLETEKVKRDLLGRWRPDGSDSYQRSYNGVVARLQKKYATAARDVECQTILDEVDIVQAAEGWSRDRKSWMGEAAIQEALSHLNDSMIGEVLSFELTDTEVQESFAEPLHVDEARGVKRQIERVEERTEGYLIVNLSKKCRRLHKTGAGGCWMARQRQFKSSNEYHTMPSEDFFTHVCKFAFHRRWKVRENKVFHLR